VPRGARSQLSEALRPAAEHGVRPHKHGALLLATRQAQVMGANDLCATGWPSYIRASLTLGERPLSNPRAGRLCRLLVGRGRNVGRIPCRHEQRAISEPPSTSLERAGMVRPNSTPHADARTSAVPCLAHRARTGGRGR
jgi:hypothetical protein